MPERSSSASRDYQIEELRIARDPKHPAHLLPPVEPAERRLLDLGCGAGQALIVLDLAPERVAVGLDVDREALRLGRVLQPDLLLVCGRGEALPFRKGCFDLVASRVALPYMDLSRSLREVGRILAPGGRIWCSLHPLRLTLGELRASLIRRQWRGALYRLFVLCNGVVLHFSGRQFSLAWLGGRRETFQTRRGMRRALRRSGFDRASIALQSGRFLIAVARTPRA